MLCINNIDYLVRVRACGAGLCCVSCEVRTEFVCVMWRKVECLCGLVVGVPACRCGAPGSGAWSARLRGCNWGAAWGREWRLRSGEPRMLPWGSVTLTMRHPSVREAGVGSADERRSLGRCGPLADSGRGVCFVCRYSGVTGAVLTDIVSRRISGVK
jgi:hypothetical protein